MLSLIFENLWLSAVATFEAAIPGVCVDPLLQKIYALIFQAQKPCCYTGMKHVSLWPPQRPLLEPNNSPNRLIPLLWIHIVISFSFALSWRENSLVGLASFPASHCHAAAAVPSCQPAPLEGRAHLLLVYTPWGRTHQVLNEYAEQLNKRD